jgi:hypothetical protein
MITYPVSPESRWAVLQTSTGEIIGRNRVWPRTDGSPIEGLDPDFVYLLQLTDAQPDYDPRIVTLEKVEAIDAPANELRTTWLAVPRPVEEVKINAANVEAVENSRHFEQRERDKLMILGLGVLFRQVANQALTAREIALKDRIIAAALKLWKNDTRLRAIMTALDAGQTPDLDAGWEPPAK